MQLLGLTAWLEIIKAALYFPDSVLRLVRALQKVPEERRAELAEKIEAEATKIAETGRPSWD